MKRMDNMRRGEPARNGLLLYVAFAAVIGMLWLERRAALTPVDHTVALLAIVGAFFVLTFLWLGREGGG